MFKGTITNTGEMAGRGEGNPLSLSLWHKKGLDCGHQCPVLPYSGPWDIPPRCPCNEGFIPTAGNAGGREFSAIRHFRDRLHSQELLCLPAKWLTKSNDWSLCRKTKALPYWSNLCQLWRTILDQGCPDYCWACITVWLLPLSNPSHPIHKCWSQGHFSINLLHVDSHFQSLLP